MGNLYSHAQLSAFPKGLFSDLPDDLLIRNGTMKYLLRKIAREWLPERVFSHPKSGFTIPLHTFQNKTYESLCRELILGDPTGIMTRLFSTSMCVDEEERGRRSLIGRIRTVTKRLSLSCCRCDRLKSL